MNIDDVKIEICLNEDEAQSQFKVCPIDHQSVSKTFEVFEDIKSNMRCLLFSVAHLAFDTRYNQMPLCNRTGHVEAAVNTGHLYSFRSKLLKGLCKQVWAWLSLCSCNLCFDCVLVEYFQSVVG